MLGGLFIRISGKDSVGRTRQSRQLAYVAEDVSKMFLSKRAAMDLGIIEPTFPVIGTFKPASEDCKDEA